MALFNTAWYVNFGNGTNTGYYAVPVRPQNAAVVAGQFARQFTAPAVGSERVWICIVAGTTANTTDATWTLLQGSVTTDGTAKWQEITGLPAVNGDSVNTMTWAAVKAAGTNVQGGTVIKRNNGASYQIASANAGLGTSEPAFSDVAGVTTTEGANVWTSLGPVTNFTGGQAPHARLANALAGSWFVVGNTVYVGDNHAETQATALTLTANSSAMARILCHNHSGPYPPTTSDLKTGATIAVTGNVTITFSLQGSFYFYGLAFLSGTSGVASGQMLGIGPSAVGQVQNWYYFDNCSLQISGGSASAAFIAIGNAGASSWGIVTFNNTTVKFANANQYIFPEFAQFLWRNTAPILVTGSTIPTTLFQNFGTSLSTVVLEGLDLSQLPSSLYSSNNQASIGNFLIKDCKLNAAATITQPTNTGQIVQNSRSSSLAAPYVSSCHTYEAIETTETSIVRSGGFTDPTGQVQSRKIVTTANAQWLRPYKAEPYAVWNSVVGSSVTATVYGLAGIGALPNNDDVWLELQYLGSGASPLGSVVTTGKAQVWSANALGVSDGSSWPAILTVLDGVPTAGLVVSNGGLTATHGTAGNNMGVNSTVFHSAGKFYFEVTATSGATNTIFGVMIPTADYSGLGGGIGGFIVSIGASSNIVNDGSATLANLGTCVVGDVFGFALDLTARLGWVRRNNGTWNASGTADPTTGVGGFMILAGVLSPFVRFSSSSPTTNAATYNFGRSAYANAAPSGFPSWDTGWTPFKLTTSFTPNLPGYILGRVRAAKTNTTFYIEPKLYVS